MRKGVLAGLAFAGAVACAGQAGAVTFVMTGTITGGSGADGVIHVGDTVTMTAAVSDDLIVHTGTGGAYVGAYRGSFKIQLDGYTWTASDDLLDQWDQPYCVNGHCSSGPIIDFLGDKITGLYAADLVPTFSSRPAFGLDGPQFSIFDTDLYGNTSSPQHFSGVWNLADSVVTIPEPATWAVMLLGFLGLGAGLRARRRQARTPACLGRG